MVVVGPLDSSVRVSFLVGSFRFEVMFRAVSENADQPQEGRMERKNKREGWICITSSPGDVLGRFPPRCPPGC